MPHCTAQVMLCSAWAHFESYFGYLYSGKETTWDIFSKLPLPLFLVSRLQTKRISWNEKNMNWGNWKDNKLIVPK